MNIPNTDIKNSSRLIPVTQWPHGYPTERAFRHLVFNAEINGFNKVVRRIGRRILIHEGEFFKWLEAKQGV